MAAVTTRRSWARLGADAEQCDPFRNLSAAAELCAYAWRHADACAGGGHGQWTRYALCAAGAAERWALWVPLGAAAMLAALLTLSTVSDRYLCTAIAAIVNQLRISQNVAGVTLMAFGNGAPDIFGMLVEVVAAESPKADLALGQLLGGGCFVTTVVVAALILHRPFRVMRRPILRDLAFYLGALGWLAFIITYDARMHYWQPLVLLLMYLAYACTVIFGSGVRNGRFLCFRWRRGSAARPARASRRSTRRKRPPPVLAELAITTTGAEDGVAVTVASGSPSKVSPANTELVPRAAYHGYGAAHGTAAGLLSVECGIHKHRSTSTLSRRSNITIVPVVAEAAAAEAAEGCGAAAEGAAEGEGPTVKLYVDHGKFFADERDPEEEDEDEEEEDVGDDDDSGGVRTSTPSPRSSLAGSVGSLAVRAQGRARTAAAALRRACRRWTQARRFEPWHGRLLAAALLPGRLLLALTTPCAAAAWNKWLTLLHCFTAPAFCALAFGVHSFNPYPDGPDLWVYILGLSTVVALVICVTTSSEREPRFRKYVLPYVSFTVSVAWVYSMAAEIVNVVMMIGVVARVSHVVLGLTVLAWSNSLGDMVADLAVAKQGFPRMAISAAIGGPLLNLLMGYGLAFFITCLKSKKPVKIDQANPRKLVMIAFLCTSLLTTMVLLVAQRFHARRFHALVLLGLYGLFILVNLLAEAGLLPL